MTDEPILDIEGLPVVVSKVPRDGTENVGLASGGILLEITRSAAIALALELFKAGSGQESEDPFGLAGRRSFDRLGGPNIDVA
jgi:hypothetical protein